MNTPILKILSVFILISATLAGCERKYTQTEREQMKTLAASIEIMNLYAESIYEQYLIQMNMHRSRVKHLKRYFILHTHLSKYAKNITVNNLTNRLYIDSIQMVFDSLTLHRRDFKDFSNQLNKLTYTPINDSLEYLILKSKVLNLTSKMQEFMSGNFIRYNPDNFNYLFIPTEMGIQHSGIFKIAIFPIRTNTYISDSIYCKPIQNDRVIVSKTIPTDDFYFTYKALPKGKYCLECKSYSDTEEYPDPYFSPVSNNYYFEIK